MKFSDKFIRANDKMCDFDNFVSAPYFRKKFNIDFVPEKAEITICGLGFYELYINGKNITKGPLAPYISNVDDVCYYDNYNVKEYLNIGENVIGVLLGNGFRNSYGGFMFGYENSTQRGPVTLALCFEAENETERFEFEADESFKTHNSPILYNDMRMGYCYDSRKELIGWNTVEFDDEDWDNAEIERKPRGIHKLCSAEPIKIVNEISPVKVEHFDKLGYAHDKNDENLRVFDDTVHNNVYVFDFGINTAGVTKLCIDGKPGQKITIRHGEHLINGEFSLNTTIFQRDDERNNIIHRKYSQADVFICKGGEETFIPKFKYDGFRYAYVEGLEDWQVNPDTLTLLEMHSDVKSRADFECSDDIINKLYECSQRSDLSNTFYFPNDCPHREKNGWTGDASVSAEHMMINFTMEKTFKEWLVNIRCAQNADGVLPGVVPTGGFGFNWGNGPAWDSVCVNLPYYVYKYTGDKSVIEENVSMIMRYLCYVQTRANERGLFAFGLGDWADPFKDQKGHITAPLEVTDSIIVYDIAKKASFMFEQIGRAFESDYARAVSNKVRYNIRKWLINDYTVSGDCQTSQALAMSTGIFDADEMSYAGEKLLNIIHRDGDINTCGMIGLRYIYHALTDIGEADLAYKIITAKSRTCYGYWIANGATTLWEGFKTIDDHKLNSRNHHFFGDISSWFIQYIAGIRPNPNADDTAHFVISPNFIEDLTSAKADYDSKYGKVLSSWERNGDNVSLNVSMPANTHGEIVLNGGYICDDGRKSIRWEKDNKIIEICLNCHKE